MNKVKNKTHSITYDTQILTNQITLIDKEKKLIGKFTLDEALAKAKLEKKHLIEISNINNTAICIIEDLNKYKYETNKKIKKQTGKKTKEIRIKSKSDLTDLLRSMQQCYQFILDKNLAVVIMLRAYRQSYHGKDEFIKQHIEAQDNITFSIQKSPRPNILKLYVTRKSVNKK